MGAMWYIRGLAIHMHREVSFGDDVEVETWVSQARRFRCRRQYAVYANGELAVAAHAEWMFLKTTNDHVRPYHFDEEILAAFPIDPARTIEDDALADFDTQFEPSHAVARTAYASDEDRYGHVNHVHYAAWVTDHLSLAGLHDRRVVQLRLQYQADVRRGESVELKLAGGPDVVQHRLTQGDKAIARAVTRLAAAG